MERRCIIEFQASLLSHPICQPEGDTIEQEDICLCTGASQRSGKAKWFFYGQPVRGTRGAMTGYALTHILVAGRRGSDKGDTASAAGR